ncbi:MAG: hypothetical protein Kapaf2KO_12770 [Candidatus Kapaibacteriales bacterium]
MKTVSVSIFLLLGFIFTSCGESDRPEEIPQDTIETSGIENLKEEEEEIESSGLEELVTLEVEGSTTGSFSGDDVSVMLMGDNLNVAGYIFKDGDRKNKKATFGLNISEPSVGTINFGGETAMNIKLSGVSYKVESGNINISSIEGDSYIGAIEEAKLVAQSSSDSRTATLRNFKFTFNITPTEQ